MRLQNIVANPNLPCAVPSLRTSGSGWDSGQRGVCEERTWRCLADLSRSAAIEADILVSRWIDSGVRAATKSTCRHPIGTLSASP
jgi:hypothetical protein